MDFINVDVFFICRNNAKYAEKILCEPCSFENLTIEATRFCETCEHPEPMCEACSKQHVRYKATRGHLICMDMEKFTENILEKGLVFLHQH